MDDILDNPEPVAMMVAGKTGYRPKPSSKKKQAVAKKKPETPEDIEGVQRRLAHNLAAIDKPVRDKAIKLMSSWLAKQKDFNIKAALVVWKALFACYWLSDKPLVQQDLAITISKFMHILPENRRMVYARAFFQTFVREWHSIGNLRMDKYFMLHRKCMLETFVFMKSRNFEDAVLDELADILKKDLFESEEPCSLGVKMQTVEVFFEELYKATGGEVSPQVLTRFVRTFLEVMSQAEEKGIVARIKSFVLDALLERWVPTREDEEEEGSMVDMGDGPGAAPKAEYFETDFKEISKILADFATSTDTLEKNRNFFYVYKNDFNEAAQIIEEYKNEISQIKQNGKPQIEQTQEPEETPQVEEPPRKKQKAKPAPVVEPTVKVIREKAKKQDVEERAPTGKEAPQPLGANGVAQQKRKSSDAEQKEATQNGTEPEPMETTAVTTPEKKSTRSKKRKSSEKNTPAAAKSPEAAPQFKTPPPSANTKKKVIWSAKNHFQEFAESLNVHPVSPAVRNKDKTPQSILKRLHQQNENGNEATNGTPMRSKQKDEEDVITSPPMSSRRKAATKTK
eukprot:TRINITY_DN8768_c0_g1_i1.p1 TRINITY_DN8768_c0_g1~~TRINITY_DN8768_c0_g1_i1.p1  ORF type:complete len:567 (-),score=192.25 TRINITY_DN8768_c0_g1_i1:28-1728(-)